MIENLSSIDSKKLKEFGRDIILLKELLENGISVDNTIVVSNNAFITYKELNDKSEFLNSLSKAIYDSFNDCDFLEINTSLYKNINGIPNDSISERKVHNISETIQKIYDAWISDGARANRITYSIPDELTYPAIYVQSNRSKLNSFVTRCPKSGQITNANNLENIHNTVKKVDKSIEELFFEIEKVLMEPIKFYYSIEEGLLKIKKVETELMTNKAKWVAINDLLFKKLITKEKYIELLEPKMIYENNGISPKSEFDKELTYITGLPASPGTSIGRLTFNFSSIDSFRADSIFCCIETSPEDLEKLDMSFGAISARGGMTSHLAVICRGMGKPAVTGAAFSIDFEKKELVFSDKKFAEFSYVMVEANTGNIYISESPISAENNYRANSDYEYLKNSFKLIKSISSYESFKEYSIEFQMKVANLLSTFNKIDFKI